MEPVYPLLALEDLSVGYGGKTVLSGVNLSVRSGEFVVLAGPNGGGKTTLLKTAVSLCKPLSGRALLSGKPVRTLGKRERAALAAFLFQTGTADWPFTVRELVAQGRFPRHGWFGRDDAEDRLAAERAIARCGLSGFEDRPVTELSGGETQRVLIARAIAQGARLLLLDEPVNSLDLKYQHVVMGLLRSMVDEGRADGGGYSVLMSLHDLNLAARYADRIVLISCGAIAADGPPIQALQAEIVARVFGVDAALLGDGGLTGTACKGAVPAGTTPA
jgi:iron complex transport system ATP-binding protein